MDRTLDIVVLVLVGGMVVMGLGSMAIGWAVNRFWPKTNTDYVTSDTGATVVPGGSSTGADDAVPPQQNQVEPASVPNFDGVLDFLYRHNLTDEEAIDILTLMHREVGDLLSANKIRDIVGGNEAAVKARVAAWRPAPEPQRSQGRVPRPDGGW